MQVGTNKIKDSHARFHQEVYDFSDWASIQDYKPRQRLFTLIKQVIQKDFHDAEFILFGSSGASLAIKGSDIDMLVQDQSKHISNLYYTVYKRLLQVQEFSYVEKVVATVPILKLREKSTGLKADITFNRTDGYKGVICAVLLQAQFPELRPMYIVLKAFLRERNLDQTYSGGICSYMLLNMIAFYLQKHYKECIAQDLSSADIQLHRHLFAFFRLYGVTLDQRENGLSIRRGGFLFQRDPRSEMSMASANPAGRAPC